MSSFQTPIQDSSSPIQPPIQPPIPEPMSPPTPDQEPQQNPHADSIQSPIQEPMNTTSPDQEMQQNPQGETNLEQEEEEEGECGFCLFMKGGGCKDSFVGWEKCIEEAEKNQEDIVEKCFEVTAALKTCMEAHSDYYEPVLRAEKAAEAEAVEQLEKEKEKEKVGGVVEGEKEKA